MESRVRHTFDSALALQAIGSDAITATALSTDTVDIYEITGSPYGALNGRQGIGSFDLVLCVVQMDHTTGDETYEVQIETVAEDGTTVTVQEKIDLTQAVVGDVLSFPLQPSTLQYMASGDAATLRLNVALAGTTPIFQYWAFLAPQSHQ